MSRELEQRIGDLVARQHGVATRRQLMDAGLSRSAIRRRLRSGRMRALHRGVYLVAPFPLTYTRDMAAVLASGRRSVLSHFNAAELIAMQPSGRKCASGIVDVTGQGEGGRRCAGIRVHRVEQLERDEWMIREGIPVTTPVRTLLDLAPLLDKRQLEEAVARAERNGLVTREQLLAYVARKRGRRGARALRKVLGVAGGPALTRSEADAKFLALVREANLPPPETNVSVGPYEVDFLWRAAGMAVEVDGFKYHGSHERFEGDRRRDAQFLASGISVLRLTWRRIVHEPLVVAVEVAQARARAEGKRR